MEDKILESKGHKFVLRRYKHKAEVEIKNTSYEAGEILLGSFQSGVIFHSLVSWDLTDDKGNPLKLTRENFDEEWPVECTNEVFEAASELNSLSREEKNALSGQSV